MPKSADESFDDLRQDQLDTAQENIRPCGACTGFWCTDDNHYVSESLALSHQYDIERGAV